LNEEWGTNGDTRSFVKAVFNATPEKLETDWSLWVKLQTIYGAPAIIKKDKPVHEDSSLAFAVWDAADKLTVHPGPLDEAIQHVSILLKSALNTLQSYQELKRENSLVDFGDMVHLAENLLQDDEWLAEIKANYDCLIIDEFQDTNPLQFSLLWKVKQAGIPTLIVGDIKQSIMGFQGADSRLFESLLKKNTKQAAELSYNWRSTEGLMEVINELGSVLYGDVYKPLEAQSGIKSQLKPVHVIEFSKALWGSRNSKHKFGFGSNSPKVVAEEVKKLLEGKTKVVDRHTGKKRPIRPNDIAILAHSHSDLQTYAASLRYCGVQPRIQGSGWFNSDAVTWVKYSLSYLADPRDQYALMCLKVLKQKECDLENALKDYLGQDKPRSIDGVVTEKLEALSSKLRHQSIPQVLTSTIEVLDLWEKFARLPDEGEQERANLLKLIHLAETFEETQPETLQAQGIYGKSLSSFLVWLDVNADEFNTQPHVDSDNEQAVVLSTWHASKGLEWPIVIVGSMDKEFAPRLPEVAVQYEDLSNPDTMMDNAYVQVLTNFKDPATTDKFNRVVQPVVENTLKNLTYVVMTRAREQLILPWFNAGKDHSMIAYMERLTLSDVKRTQACSPDDVEVVESIEEKLKPYGRVAIDTGELDAPVVEQLSPSSIAEHSPDLVSDYIAEFTHEVIVDTSAPINLVKPRKEYGAGTVGEWVHLVYQALLKDHNNKDRVLKKLTELANYEDFCNALPQQIINFEQELTDKFGVCEFEAEVPMIARADNDSVISGVIDLLVKTDKGYLIIDHKTDEKIIDEAFGHHCLQLAAYAKYLKLDIPIAGIGVNWVQQGKVQILSL